MKVGSLFSGIGGIDLAFERAGFDVAWQVEWNPDAQSVLRRHWPAVPLYGDITTVDPTALRPVDVVVFGSPCQDLSVAGKREGLGGAHSGLFFEAIRIIRSIRPSMALWENVPGAFSSNAGRDFAAVLAAFRDSGAREIGWRILDAQYCGVPQRRRRIFLVADFGGERASEILFEPESLRGDPPPRREAGEIAPSLLASGAGTNRPAGIGSEADFCVVEAPAIAGTMDCRNRCDRGENTNLIVLQDAVGVGSSGAVAHAVRAQASRADKPSSTTYITEPVAHTVTAQYASHGGKSAGNNPGIHNAVLEVVHTLRGEGFDGSEDGTGRGTPLVPTQSMRVRRLMPVETERLQGLPDDWTRYTAEGKEVSDSARYRLVGNSVAVPAVEWIARRMARALKGDTI